jgi:hypothetical protein
MSEASQTFGRAAADYAAARPTYPAALYDWLAEIAPRRGNVWDCGTGNGQAARDLALRFQTIHATDFSAGQIAAALPVANVTYAVEPAEHCSRPDGWADLMTVANALHWFDFDSFWPEVKRVGAADAVFVAWGYNWVRVSPVFDATVTTPFRDIIAPFWAPNNKLNWNGYRDADIKFPFRRIPHPGFAIEVEWSFRQILAFMQTWSAYRLCLKNAETAKAMADFLAHIETVHPPDKMFTARMPLVMVAGSVNS